MCTQATAKILPLSSRAVEGMARKGQIGAQGSAIACNIINNVLGSLIKVLDLSLGKGTLHFIFISSFVD